MPAVTVNDLNNAQLDVNTIASVATSTAPTVTDRLGNTKNTLSGMNAAVLASAAAVQSSIGYLPPVAYSAGISLTLAAQTVGYSGQTYAPILSVLPFTTSGTFETAKFRLIQGVSGADLAASSGAGLVGWIRGIFGAINTTLAKWMGWQQPSIFEFMTDTAIADCVTKTGSIDAYAAVQAAIDGTTGRLRALNGMYRLSAQPIIRGRCTGIVGEGSYTTVFDKRFNGECFSSLTDGAVISGFGIAGNGSIYTGGGILPQGYNTVIEKMRINDTADSPIIVNSSAASNALAATYLSVQDCFLNPTNAVTTASIRGNGIDNPVRPTCRIFTRISGGSSLVDFSGMNYAVLKDSLGTWVKFSFSSAKINMNGNRITAQSNIDINGQDHNIDGNTWSFVSSSALSINAAATNVFFGPNNQISIGGVYSTSILDGSPIGSKNTNNLSSQQQLYAFGWYGSTSNYAAGNGSFYARYKQEGRMCFATFGGLINTTTTIAIGSWTFQLPFLSAIETTGTCVIRSSEGNFYSAVVKVFANSSLAYLYLVVPSANTTRSMSSSDLAFSTNATFDASVAYILAV